MKIVVVVLVVILVLFVAVIGIGARQDRGGVNLAREGLGEDLREMLIGAPKFVTASHLLGTCVRDQSIAVGPGGSCTLAVVESDDYARKLRLVHSSGLIEVEFDQPRGVRATKWIPVDPDAEEQRFDPDVEFNVMREGASLKVTCELLLDPCVLAIATSS